ncbi:uncharacterized protein CEXT_121521 [Caerostris extrusa]|uniref:Uncharacterized protein n=1 Tax=Caerostris extrusa TaxID=172846 RepID=A0AAV4RH93_CAEEX|nr:uncharacterized protein CEXT_121521 [Caerostris extrusa]
MAKSLSSRSELKAITESEFSIAFETALDLVGTKASMQAYSENFSSEISKLLGKKRLLLEASLKEKADFIANVIVHGLPMEKVSPELKTFSQNLGENNNADVGFCERNVFGETESIYKKKYAAAFAFEIAHVFDTYEILSWDKIREYVESISQAMLSGLPADISTKEEKQANNIIHKEQDNDTLSNLSLRFGKQKENLTSIDILEYQLLTSELFNETFNGSMSFQNSFELAEVVSQAVINISESKIVGKLTYSLPYYAAIRIS